MGIDTEVLGGLLMTTVGFLLILYGIDLGVSMTKVERLLRFRRLQVVGVFELMPAPVRHGVQGHTCPVFKRVALQTGNIDSRGEVSVAYAE